MSQEIQNKYLSLFDKYTEDYVTTFSRFDKQTFNVARAPGAWSPGQCMDHMLKSDRGILGLLNAPSMPNGDAPAITKHDDFVAFMVTDTKRTSPERLLPTQQVYPLVETMDEFVDIRADMRTAFDFASDISGLVEIYSHPAFGKLTKCEWFFFSAAHGERHRRQFQADAASTNSLA